jgi:hypothetical protein
MARCVKGLHRPADEPATGIHAPPPVMTGMFVSLYGIQKSRWEGSTAQLMSCCRMLFSRRKSANICAHLRVCVCMCVCVCVCLPILVHAYSLLACECARVRVLVYKCVCLRPLRVFNDDNTGLQVCVCECKYASLFSFVLYVCACHMFLCAPLLFPQ